MKNMLQDNGNFFDKKSAPKSDEELILLTRKGYQNAFEEIVRRYSEFVRFLARPYFIAGGDAEDLVQEGMIGLLNAVREYDSSKGVLFKTFAGTCVKNKLLSALKLAARNKHNPLNNYISLEPPFFDSNPEQIDAVFATLGASGDPVELVIGNEAFKELSELLRGLLSGFELEVLELYLDGNSYSVISQKTEKPIKSIDNAIQRIRRKVANYFHSRHQQGS